MVSSEASLAYEKIRKMRKAPMTIAPSRILKLVSFSLIHVFFSGCLPSSVVIPRAVAVIIAFIVVIIAVAKSQVSFLTPQMNPQLRKMIVEHGLLGRSRNDCHRGLRVSAG